MKREFLKDLGIEDGTIDKIMDENSSDIGRMKSKADTATTEIADLKAQIAARDTDLAALKASATTTEAVQAKLTELEGKYTTDTEALTAKLADRDYLDAITRTVSGASIKFSSKAAEKAYLADLKERKLEIKDGVLDGFDNFHREQTTADPTAFEGDAPAPFVKAVGNGEPAAGESKFAAFAKNYGAQFVPQEKKE